MTITSEHNGVKWAVTIKVDGYYAQRWLDSNLKQALIIAHAKLLNKIGAERKIIISSK